MLVGSLGLGDMIDAQKNVWFIVLQPVAGLIFYITLLAETNRAPFDLPDAEQELTAGYHSEYSGMKFGAFFLAEYVKMIAVSAIFATVFLGGFRFFGLESLPIHIGAVDLTGWLGPIILIAKIVPSLLLMVWIRATLPRLRYDYLMALGWKILLPLSLLNLIVTAVLVVLGVFPTFGA
jgi:NADH-quinone oxidoreductase subunit H